MSAWTDINRVFEEAGTLEYLAKMRMEGRPGMTWKEAVAWAVEQKRMNEMPIPNPESKE